jgi:hypothetical protein
MACSCGAASAVVCADTREDISPIELAAKIGTTNRKQYFVEALTTPPPF